MVDAVLAEAGRFADEVIAPLNAVGDRHGAPFKDGAVTTPPGWQRPIAPGRRPAGTGSPRPPEFGGQGLPHGASMPPASKCGTRPRMAFGLGPLLTMGAIEALAAHGSDELKRALSAQARVRRMDRHDEPHRAAGGLRRRRAAHPRRAAPATAAIASSARRSSSPTASTTSPTTSSTSCWRACPTRRPARAASRCSSCRSSWSNADGSLGRAQRRALRGRSSTSSASTPRPTCTMVFGDKGGAIG